MIAGIEALEALPATTQVRTAIQTWLTDALPAPTNSDADADEDVAAPNDDSTAWRGASLGRFLASPGHLHAAVDGCERCIAVLNTVAETRSGTRAAVAFASHGLGIALAGLGRPEEALQALTRARADFAKFATMPWSRLRCWTNCAMSR
jgi:hypothetical protein